MKNIMVRIHKGPNTNIDKHMKVWGKTDIRFEIYVKFATRINVQSWSADPLRAVERVGVPLSICRSLFFYVFYSFLSFCSKVILLLITNLYQIPPKPSPAEANPSPEHLGGTPMRDSGGTRVECVKTWGTWKVTQLSMFWPRICRFRKNKQCFGHKNIDFAIITNVLAKNISISQ